MQRSIPTRIARAFAVLSATLVVGHALAQSPPDLTGAWERYRGPAGDTNTPPPEATPPLKPKLLKEWEERRAAERAADARGEPIAKGYVQDRKSTRLNSSHT